MTMSNRPKKGSFTLWLCLALSSYTALLSAQVDLFHPAPPTRSTPLAPGITAGAVRQRFVTLEPAAAADLATTVPASQISLNLFDDVRVKVELARPVPSGPGSYIRSGQVDGKPFAGFQMAVVGEATVMDVRMQDGVTYSVRYRGNGIHEITEILEAAQPPCGVTSNTLPVKMPTAPLPSSMPMRSKQPGAADSASEVDVLVAFTQEAENYAGGPSGIEALIDLAFAYANTSYANSQIPLTIIKVKTVKVSYTPNSDMTVDLSRVAGKTDGYMDELHTVRDLYRADLVCLLRGTVTGGACGYGYIMTQPSEAFESYGFVVCASECISNQTFAHELGHNMGCNHDVGNSSGATAYPYCYGWRWNGISSGNPQYRSVMAYAPGQRVQYFSNPNVFYDGKPTGVAATANNALAIQNTAVFVANFRQRLLESTVPTLYTAKDPIQATVKANTITTVTHSFGNSGPGIITYTLTEDAPWATLTPATATVTGPAVTSHSLVINSAGLAKGVYTANIIMSSPGVINSPLSIPLQLTVTTPPANDDFANAEVLTGSSGTVTGNSAEATREAGEPAIIGEFNGIGQRSIWYSWTAPPVATATFTTLGSAFDTLMGVYTGSLGALVKVADNDDASGSTNTSKVTFAPVGGVTYKILIDGWSGASGPSQLNWTTVSTVGEWSLY